MPRFKVEGHEGTDKIPLRPSRCQDAMERQCFYGWEEDDVDDMSIYKEVMWTDELFDEIQKGDRVWYENEQGQTCKGKAVMVGPMGWVLTDRQWTGQSCQRRIQLPGSHSQCEKAELQITWDIS